MDTTVQIKQRLIEDIDIRGKKVPIDKGCVPLIKFFNRNGLDTKFCCEGHNRYENFEIMFEDYVTDEQMVKFLNQYANKYNHSPFIGKFVKWYRRMSGNITSNWIYAVDTVEQADIDYRRLISGEFKVAKNKIKFKDIKEDFISIKFENSFELEKLVKYLKEYDYDYGTAGGDVHIISDCLGIEYFGENTYLSLDKSKSHYFKNYVSCGWGINDKVYKFSEIDWSK